MTVALLPMLQVMFVFAELTLTRKAQPTPVPVPGAAEIWTRRFVMVPAGIGIATTDSVALTRKEPAAT